MTAITNQPKSITESTELYKSGPLTIRTLTDTDEDGVFFGYLLTEAFKDKLVHATKESRLPIMRQYNANHCRGRPQEFYDRVSVAEYDGKRVGICGLRYQGDEKKFPERSEDAPLGFDCCDMCGMMCLDCVVLDSGAGEEYCCIDYICVDGEYTGKGIGKALLDIAEKDAMKNGIKFLYLQVVSTNPAKRLYHRQGYEVTNTATCCVKCAIEESKIARMEKPLKFN